MRVPATFTVSKKVRIGTSTSIVIADWGAGTSDIDAAFQAGAALAALDTLARAQPPWSGAWRQRLALKCAAASMRLAGRAEDAVALRDAWHLRPAGADPGPAGAIPGAWRQLAVQPPAASADWLAKTLKQLGLRWDGGALADLCTASKNSRLRSGRRRSPLASSTWGLTASSSPGGSPTWCWRKACAGRGRCHCHC
ncbi:hypothetical protein ABID26_003848 [Mesorhizobium shonense]|uniref:Uncharacterized protein n=1 Tax=Mesorhizobium shonense TaxID=1209948 RepID=A0ABV2HV06_9HYPH